LNANANADTDSITYSELSSSYNASTGEILWQSSYDTLRAAQIACLQAGPDASHCAGVWREPFAPYKFHLRRSCCSLVAESFAHWWAVGGDDRSKSVGETVQDEAVRSGASDMLYVMCGGVKWYGNETETGRKMFSNRCMADWHSVGSNSFNALVDGASADSVSGVKGTSMVGV
jgi:hypothetical protein